MVVETIQLKSCHGRSPDEGVFIVIQCEGGIAGQIIHLPPYLRVYIHLFFFSNFSSNGIGIAINDYDNAPTQCKPFVISISKCGTVR